MSAAELRSFDTASRVLLRETQAELAVITREYSGKYIANLEKIEQPIGKNRAPGWVKEAEITVVEPGQLWFVELPAGADLSPFERRALTTANVVIYDRSLTDTVASILPLGAYAEPAVSVISAQDQSLERCFRFVLDGWSVVRLIDLADLPLRERVGQIQRLSEQLLAARSSGKLPITLFAHQDTGTLWKTDAHLGGLGAAVDRCAPENRLALILGAVRARSAPTFLIGSSNGLAG